MATQIFETYSDFINRENLETNGVSPGFAEVNPNWEKENETNKGCWNCSYCSYCSYCSDCSDCSDCSLCYDCSDCSDCSRCYDCSDCSYCYDCSDCSYCSRCSYCSDCSDCYDCSDCSGCSRCSDCSDYSDCSGRTGKDGAKEILVTPKVEDLNKKVAEAVAERGALNMKDWHTCDTTHCWAGWITHLAGEEGKKLEEQTSTEFAAMMIFKESNGESISPVNFYLPHDKALAKINEYAA